VKRQPVPRETPRENGQHAPSIALVSEDEGDVIGLANQERRSGEPWFHLVFEPNVHHLVEVDIG
jgi:hypothetical protein